MNDRANGRPLRILQISPEYPPHNIGGGGRVVQDISRRLAVKGELAGVLAGYYPTSTPFDQVPPLTDQFDGGCLQVEWLPLLPSPSQALRTYMPPGPLAFLAIVRRLLRKDYDLIHLHGYGTLVTSLAAVLARLLRRRYVMTMHGFPRSPDGSGGAIKLFYRLYAKTLGAMALGGARRIVAISRAIEEETVSYGARPDRIAVIPNGIDLGASDDPYRGDIRRELGLAPSDRIVVSVGALHERKGFQHLVAALPEILKKHPDVVLVIAGGDAGYRKEVESQAERLGVSHRITLAGFMEATARDALVREAEVYAIPSLVEPFGLVALEGMKAGKAIVSSRADGLGEILEDGATALLTEPGDHLQLASAIGRLLDDPATAARLAENARRTVVRYDWTRIMVELDVLYHDAAEEA